MDLQTWWEKGSKPNQYGRVRQPEVLITLNHFKTGDGIHWKPVSWKPVDIQGGCHRKKLTILFTWVYEQNNLWTAMVTGIRVAWKRKWESPLSINQSYMLYENYYRTVTGKKNKHHYYKNSNQTHLWIKQEHIDRDELITAPHIPRLPKTQPNGRPSTDFKSERKTWELAITQ